MQETKQAPEMEREQAEQRQRAIEWQQWIAHPLTQRFYRYLMDRRNNLKEEWAAAKMCPDNPQEWLSVNAEALGEARTLKELIELTSEDMERFYERASEQFERYSPERKDPPNKAGRSGGY